MDKSPSIHPAPAHTGITNCFDTVAAANLEAIRLMRQRKSLESAQLLEQSLSILERAVGGLCPSQLQTKVMMPLLQSVTMKLQHCGNEAKSFFLFCEAFTFVPSPQEVLISIDSLQEILSCTMLYNLGLCLHLRAFQGNTSPMMTKQVHGREENLDEARMAYESALIDFDCWEEQPHLLRTLELALNNNLAHINIHFMRRQDAHMDMLRMSSLLTDQHGCRNIPKSMASSFMQNLYHNCTIADRTAPAA